MNARILQRLALFVFAGLALLSFYIFSRFTVDDAFISWRYGKNLMASGIWGYNPTRFDLTQAYTNPIIAALSVVPAWLGIDVVLFFKSLAMISLVVPFMYIRNTVTQSKLWAMLYLALLALPATMIHAFSGLETYLFASVLGMLLIALVREQMKLVHWLALILLFVRPEAWLLVGLVPAYVAYQAMRQNAGDGIHVRQLNMKTLQPTLQSFLLLGGCFAAYAWFHWQHFGYVLPNTFYIKSGGTFDWKLAVWFGFFLSPALILLRRHAALLVFIALFYALVIYNYASSDLQMNYAARFAYHIFAPVYLLVAYVAATESRANYRRAMAALALAFLAVFAYRTSHPAGLLNLANYYPRMLQAHAALGKQIAKIADQYAIERFALSDAGMAAYHSGIIAFDNTGLGSAMVAHAGPTLATMAQYHPDLVVLRADDHGVVVSSENKRNLLQWAMDAGYRPVCDVVLKPNYHLRMFAAKPMPDFDAVCEQSKAANDLPDTDYAAQHNTVPPWRFWHE